MVYTQYKTSVGVSVDVSEEIEHERFSRTRHWTGHRIQTAIETASLGDLEREANQLRSSLSSHHYWLHCGQVIQLNGVRHVQTRLIFELFFFSIWLMGTNWGQSFDAKRTYTGKIIGLCITVFPMPAWCNFRPATNYVQDCDVVQNVADFTSPPL